MIKKIYMSRAETRAMAAEHPIGDPTGGPAYGEKNDPISAAISIASMGASYAAAGTFAAMTVMQGITFAGAALSLVGNVTGNKSLMKLGMVAGIAGGIGSLAESAGLFESGNLGEKLGITTSVPDEALRAGSSAVTPGAQAPVVDGVQTSPVVDAASAPPAVNNQPLNVNAPGGAANPLNAGPGGATSPLNAPNLGTDILGRPLPQMSVAPGMGGPNLSAGAPAGPGVIDSIKAGNYMDAAKAAGSGAMDALKNNPTGAYVAAQAVGAVANVLSGKTGAELEALKANTGYANAKALEVQEAIAKEQRRRANIANGYANVKMGNMTVNTNANMTANPTGLITGARG
jgi:hypothetical protein